MAPGHRDASFALLYLKQTEASDPFFACNLACYAEIANVLANGTVVSEESIYTAVDALQEVTWSGSLADSDGVSTLVLRRDSLSPEITNGTVLSISKDHGASWRDAVFPFVQDVDASYAIVTSTLGVGDIVAARPTSQDDDLNASVWSNLYMSRSEGRLCDCAIVLCVVCFVCLRFAEHSFSRRSTRYIEILPFVRVGSNAGALWGTVDAELGHDVDGVMLANSYRVLRGLNERLRRLHTLAHTRQLPTMAR